MNYLSFKDGSISTPYGVMLHLLLGYTLRGSYLRMTFKDGTTYEFENVSNLKELDIGRPA